MGKASILTATRLQAVIAEMSKRPDMIDRKIDRGVEK